MDKRNYRSLIETLIPRREDHFFETLVAEYRTKYYRKSPLFADFFDFSDVSRPIVDPYHFVLNNLKFLAEKENGHLCTAAETHSIYVDDQSRFEESFQPSICGEETIGFFRNPDTMFISYTASFKHSNQLYLWFQIVPDWTIDNLYIWSNRNRRTEEYTYRHITSRTDLKAIWFETNREEQFYQLSMIDNFHKIVQEGEIMQCSIPER